MTTKQLIAAVSILLIILVSYLYIDRNVAWWCNQHISAIDKETFKKITHYGESTLYLVGFALGFLIFRYIWKKPHLENISLFIFGSVASAGIVSDIIKVIAGRHRPSELFEQGQYGFDFFHIERAMTSFPSGHTATAFALATAIAYLWPKSGIPMFFFAILIGISRLAIGAHYPSDVVGGAVVGVLSTWMVIRYWNHSERFKNKVLR